MLRRSGGRPTSTRRMQSGLTLLESLVALVVLAIAVLSLLAIQMRTLADARTGVYRAQAVRTIEDLGERIKSNPEGFKALADYVSEGASSAASSPDCENAPCTPEQLAHWDLAAWRENAARRLPGGQALTFLSSQEAEGSQRQLGVMLAWRANEYRASSDYTDVFQISSSQVPTDVACPANLICHLVYVQP